MDYKHKLKALLEEKAARFASVSDAIWDQAETRFSVSHSADLLCGLLCEEGFSVERGIAGMEHAFIATVGSGKPVIGLLAEYDALSGMSQVCDLASPQPQTPGAAGHGCGHNVIGVGSAAGAIGAAHFLREQGAGGTIKVFGCPAEESGYGKAFMAKAGVFDAADILLSWHPMDSTGLWGMSTLAVNQLYFDFKGIAAHAGAAPEQGRSALDAAELMNVGVQFLREHIISNARIHYAFLDVGGQAANVVQPTASLHYFVRAPKQEDARAVTERVINIAKGAALMTDTQLEVRWDSAAANYIVNKTLGDLLYRNLSLVGPLGCTDEELEYARPFYESQGEGVLPRLKERYRAAFPEASEQKIEELSRSPFNATLAPPRYTDQPMTGSTDVGDASWIAPTGQITVSYGPNGSGPHSWQWVAMGKSSLAHKAMLLAGKVLALTALDLIEDSRLVAAAKAEHLNNLGGRTYQSAMPDSVRPN